MGHEGELETIENLPASASKDSISSEIPGMRDQRVSSLCRTRSTDSANAAERGRSRPTLNVSLETR